MALTDNGGMSPADIAAVTGNNNGWGFGGEGGLFWLLVLFLFGFGNNGWGGNGFGGNGGVPFVDNSIQRGFDQQSIMTGITGLNNAVNTGFGNVQTALCGGFAGVNQGVSNGFAQAEIANNARQIADMNQNFGMQTAMMQGFNGLQGQFASCCCDNKLGLANLGADLAREACADRQAVSEAMMGLTAQNNANTNTIVTAMNAGFQSVKDQMCQDKIDAKNEEIANLRTQLNMQNLAASQAQQTAQLIADNTAQTQYVVNRVAPYPIPSYNVANPYGNNCGCNNSGCCGA